MKQLDRGIVWVSLAGLGLILSGRAEAAPTDGYVQYANSYYVQNWTTNVGSGCTTNSGVVTTVAQYGDSRCELRWSGWPNQNTYNQFEFDAMFDAVTEHTCIHQIKSNTGGEPIYLQVQNPGTLRNDNGSVFASGMAGTWFHVNSLFNPVNGDGRLYINGSLQVTRNYPTASRDWYFKNGCYNNGLPVGGKSTASFKNFKNWVLPATAPAAPTGLVATAGNAQVRLTWMASAGATSYYVKRSTTSGSSYTAIGNPATTNYTDTGVLNGTPYYYVVSATNGAGASADSAEVSATPFDPGYQLAVSPSPQTVTAGESVDYTVTMTTNGGFSGTVALGAGGLPFEASAQFNPSSLADAGIATLTVQTTTNTPGGSYGLAIFGTNNAGNVSASFTLVVSNEVALPGPLIWTGGGGDLNWSTSLNWTNPVAGGYGPPGPGSDVVFTNLAAVSGAGVTNNIFDVPFTINSLDYGISPSAIPNTNHTTLIAPGVTLNVTGTTTFPTNNSVVVNPGLLVGYSANTGNGGNYPITCATIEGDGGTLNVDNPGADVFVAQFSTQGNHPASAATRAVLDMSGSDTFTANIARLLVGCWANGSAGTLYLAQQSTLTISGGSTAPGGTSYTGIDIGNNNSNAGEPSYLYLGQSSSIYVNSVRAGAAKGYYGVLAFNPALAGQNPTAYFRGLGGDNSRVSLWIVSDLEAAGGSANVTNPRGTNDFSGGSVDILADAMAIGKTTTAVSTPGVGTSSNRVSIGTLTFDAGTVNVNNLTNGWQLSNFGGNSTDTGIGTINVNGSGTLIVNSNLILAVGTTNFPINGNGVNPTNIYGIATNAWAEGTLNLNGGSVLANRIVAGGGRSTISSVNGTLVVTNAAGTPASPLGALNLTNSTLHLNVDGAILSTNIAARSVSAGGLNLITIDSLNNVTNAVTFPLISYATLDGSVAANFAVSGLPAGFEGGLVDDTGRKTIDLAVAPVVTGPQFDSWFVSGADLFLHGTNGEPFEAYYLLESTNVALPIDEWTVVATNSFDDHGAFSFTNALDPNQRWQFFRFATPPN